MHYSVIILDFDGTIVESVGIKDAAFEELFKGFPDHLDDIVHYHLSHNATVRFEKFEYIYRNILNLKYNEEIEKSLSERFSELVFQKIINCPYVPGALEFLQHFQNTVPLYLVSFSPGDELDKILDARNLKLYFSKVYSSSWNKVDAILDILLKESISPKDTVFIGDAYEDYLAARSTSVSFICRNSNKNFHGSDLRIFNDLRSIKDFLDSTVKIKLGNHV